MVIIPPTSVVIVVIMFDVVVTAVRRKPMMKLSGRERSVASVGVSGCQDRVV